MEVEEGQPQHKLNSAEMRRQWRQHRQRQYEYRLAARFVIRGAIWLLSVYLVRCWRTGAVPLYLALSLGGVLAVRALIGGGEATSASDVHHPPRPPAAPAAAAAPMESEGGETADEEEEASARTAAPSAPSTIRSGASPSPTAVRADIPVYDGKLTQPQQRALMLAMRQVGTPGATRCAVDASFRRTLVHDALSGGAVCACGSGASFEACCAPVKDALLAVLTEL